jgi:tetratricopeptide (TPR) repeat protein
MSDALNAAIELHQAGDLGLAAFLYERVVRDQPDNADALHLLGVLRHQQGYAEQAVKLILQAISLRPEAPAFHANLAEAYRAMGELDRAVQSCQTALSLGGDTPDTLNNLGLAYYEKKDLAQAAAHFNRALQLDPRSAAAHNNLGMTLRDQRHVEQAIAEFTSAIECDPGFAAARSNLGQLLLDHGRPAEALAQCEEAIRLHPDHAVSHHALANALRAAGRGDEARAQYEVALRLDPMLVESSVQLGLFLQDQGKFKDAWPHLDRAAELDASNTLAWQRLAELHEKRDDYGRATAAWERAVHLTPDQAALRVSYGFALQSQELLAKATEQYEAALGIDPNCAAAHLHLGGVAEQMGELQQAQARYRRALEIDPCFSYPRARLALLLRGKLPAEDLIALQARLDDSGLNEESRSQLLFGLAQVLDALGEYSQAAQFSREANTLKTRRLIRAFHAYRPEEHEQYVDQVLKNFTPELFARMDGAGLTTHRPIFVFGLPRSGTTLIEQVLASHSAVHGAGELRLGRLSFESLPRLLNRPGPAIDCVAFLDRLSAGRLARLHFDKLQERDGGHCERIVDKMPDNYLVLGLLAILFPNATFIHCRRDLRDCALSSWMQDFRSISWSTEPENLTSRFKQYLRLMRHWEAVLPVTMCRVDYEQTVSDLESVSRRLVDACGLEWEPACLDFHRTARAVHTASVTQVRQPIYSTSVRRWKNYEHELPELFAALPEDGC